MADVTSEGINEFLKKINIEYSFVGSMLRWSNMDYCLADLTSDVVNE